jgi:hypothetical protein
MSAVDQRHVLRNIPATFVSWGEKEVMMQRTIKLLSRSPYAELRRVACEFHEGLLVLRGRVSSFYMKQLAQTAFLEMDGIDEICNQIEVAESDVMDLD